MWIYFVALVSYCALVEASIGEAEPQVLLVAQRGAAGKLFFQARFSADRSLQRARAVSRAPFMIGASVASSVVALLATLDSRSSVCFSAGLG